MVSCLLPSEKTIEPLRLKVEVRNVTLRMAEDRKVLVLVHDDRARGLDIGCLSRSRCKKGKT